MLQRVGGTGRGKPPRTLSPERAGRKGEGSGAAAQAEEAPAEDRDPLAGFLAADPVPAFLSEGTLADEASEPVPSEDDELSDDPPDPFVPFDPFDPWPCDELDERELLRLSFL